MSHSTEQIFVPDSSVPLPWLDERWSVAHGKRGLATSSAGSDGAVFNDENKSSIRTAEPAASVASWADVSHEPRTATPDRVSTTPVATHTPPRQDKPPSRPTAHRNAMAILWLVGLGSLALVAI